ncbi:ubiquitin-like modifier-activating enzyme atg7 isoform X2 [Topomyia yanbarensis]|uniref:ubiquitin-like modifier-activating enzyme atg7 isoform X2 n=1 Tax=Topomyia yanbarensis TaxID=2498891 RepID=UPI00273BFC23|nr:ubiquitin-like modifier-activating enzyme atg7 isoform X2 [Topomyia yanbarensis]
MEKSDKSILKFVPPKSFVHTSFWYKLADIKLNVDKLKDSEKNVSAFIRRSNNSRVLIEIDCSAFNNETCTATSNIWCNGILLNKNTIEEFKTTCKNRVLKDVSTEFYQNLLSKEKLDSFSQWIKFLIFSFADFKTHKYYYWFAFPVLRDVVYKCSNQRLLLKSLFTKELLLKFEIESSRISEPFFIYDINSNIVSKISDIVTHKDTVKNMCNMHFNSSYFCCLDHSSDENPSWLLRQFLGYLFITCPVLKGKEINCICLREEVSSSIVLRIQMPDCELDIEEATWIGWEANEAGKFIPRLADMAKTMDPLILAEKSISLNLTLMKWRLLPELDINIIRKTKFLLLGAGTLGCGVARSLLAWGAQHISFVDYGKVSLSNPVRQNLFLYEDALQGGKSKATTAAERLKQIHPCITSVGYCLQIPMPGHSVGESQWNNTNETLDSLKDLIKNHDVVFLLTDSRESRWLPTMLAAFYKKMVINAALGFDSFLVMRHGTKISTSYSPQVIEGFKEIQGSSLGCYFCNDIVAPGNSLKDRTLDQQCTVTRPAVSNIASSLAVELAVALLQHKYRDAAPAYYQTSNDILGKRDIPEDILGIVPHSIRGNISAFNYLITATERFSECIACSIRILDKFEHEGNDFVMNVLNSSKILEDISGISTLTCNAHEDIDFESDDE